MSAHRWRFVSVLAGLILVLPSCGGDDDGGNGGDHTAPVVSITFPPADTTVTGSVTIFAEATDNIAVSHIDFYIDAQKHHTDSTMPYTYDWDCSLLTDSTTHSIFVKALDAAGNAGTSDTVTVLVRSGDTIAPGLVLDLAVIDSSGSSVTLRWTAPGDDGAVGRAALYDIRYIRTDIDPLAWESATPVSGEPLPATAGAVETMTLNGLAWGTRYTLAMRTADESGNWSGISNPVSTTTYQEITTQKVIDCPPSLGGGGDMISRGFYITDVPSGQLAKVTLYVAANVAGQYTLLLTARKDTYDGEVIGIGRAVVQLSDSVYANREATFLFPLPVINADSVVAFAIQLVSGPDDYALYSTADCSGDCQVTCPIIETEGTIPPLDTFRRFGMAAKVYVVGQI
jgi:hypothetical protein